MDSTVLRETLGDSLGLALGESLGDGDTLGFSEGEEVGRKLGISLGLFDGIALGITEATPEGPGGDRVGRIDGVVLGEDDILGVSLGLALGESLGDGDTLGFSEGGELSRTLGTSLGLFDGIALGNTAWLPNRTSTRTRSIWGGILPVMALWSSHK